MSKKKQASRPKDLGLEVYVSHPTSSADPRIQTGYEDRELDHDGHNISYEMSPMPGEDLVVLTIRRGMATTAAASLLRKLADLLERHGGTLLNMPRGGEGFFDSTGEMVADPLQVKYDENGDIIVPDIE